MSLVTLRLLWCDLPDCDEEIGPEHDAPTLRKFAKADGWERINGVDFCPHHADLVASYSRPEGTPESVYSGRTVRPPTTEGE